MRLDLREMIGVPGHALPFDYAPDLTRVLDGSLIEVLGTPRAVGQVRNDAGALSLNATVEAVFRAVCARCLAEFPYTVRLELYAALSESDEARDDPELYYVGGGTLDADEVIVTELILSAETVPLCSPDCEGLCPDCGKNLNEGECACKKATDPRLAVLEQLLDQ
jgi:uncharacterized protein